MKNVLVAAIDTVANDEGDLCHHMFRGASQYSDAIMSECEDDQGRGTWMRSVKVWQCVEADLTHLVNQLSTWHPTHEIRVFKLDTVYYRQPGELKSKTVTKDGVVPF